MAPNNKHQIDSHENTIDTTQLDLATEQIIPRIKDVIEIDPNFGLALYLKCWLTLGKLNVDKTEKIIREAMQWRKEKNTEYVITQPCDPYLEREMRLDFDGRSRSGFLVVTAYLGLFKLRQTLGKCGVDAAIHHFLQNLGRAEKICIELAQEVSKRNTNEDVRTMAPVRKNWILINAKGLSYLECVHTGVVQVVVALVRMAVSDFPGLEGAIVIINAGRFLELVLKVIRPLVAGSSIDLITFGSDEAAWKAFVHEYVDPNQLRTPFGGTIEY